MKKNAGFGVISIIIVIAVILVLGLIGWRVWNVTRFKAAPESSTNKNSNSLVNGRVTFSTPDEWSVQLKEGVLKFVGSTAVPANGTNTAIITPSKAALNSYKEPFKITISVYKDTAGQKSPKMWFERDLTISLPTSSDETSTDKINGYDVYVFKKINDSYDEYNYVLRHNGLYVYVNWRPIEGKQVGAPEPSAKGVDNSSYNPEILKMIGSININ